MGASVRVGWTMCVLWGMASIAIAQQDYAWNGTTGSFADSSRWSLGGSSPAGPPGAGQRALFYTGSGFTVSGSGSPAQVVIYNNVNATFTGVLSPQGGVTGFPSLVYGLEVGPTGSATFTGAAARLNSAAPIAVAQTSGSTGTLTFANGAQGSSLSTPTTAAVVLGVAFSSNATMLLQHPGTKYTATGTFLLGGRGVANLTVTDAAMLNTNGVLAQGAAGLNIGGGDSSGVNTTATLTIANGGVVHNELQTNLGLYGKGTINISGGTFTTTDGDTANPALSIARFANSEGHLNVSGTGYVVTDGEIIVGGGGIGEMTIADEGLVESFVTAGAPAIVGFGPSAEGLVTIDGYNGQWYIANALVVGQQGTGEIEINDGGTLFMDWTDFDHDPYLHIGEAQDSLGTITVSGMQSALDASFVTTTLGEEVGAEGRLEITQHGNALLQRTHVGESGEGDLSVNNHGSLFTGTAVIGAQATGSGAAALESGGTWEIGGQLYVGLEGSGEMLVDNTATLSVGEFISIGEGPDSFGTFTVDGEMATINGNYTQVYLGYLGHGEVYVQNGAQWTVPGDVTMGEVEGVGIAHVDATSDWIATGSFFVGGSNASTGGEGTMHVLGSVSAGTAITVWDNGTVELIDDGVAEAPLVTIHGELTGHGTVEATTVLNDGRVAPHRSSLQVTGKIEIEGNYEETEDAQLSIQIGGLTPVTEYDQLLISGVATLRGGLDVELVDLGFGTFNPLLGHEFLVMTAMSFDPLYPIYDLQNLTLPPLDQGLAWLLESTETELWLRVVEAPGGVPGDFNGDGFVTLADYTVWRDNLGAADELALNGNGNGLGGVDGDDYAWWKSHFGAPALSSVSTTTVPEPRNCVLLALTMMLAFAPWARRSDYRN